MHTTVTKTTITVIIPTYRRPKDLERCLEALKQQTRPVDELLVVVRDTDAETWAFLAQFNPEGLPLRTVTVTFPGQVAALNAGLDVAQGDIISITDDDAAPHPDWLERIEAHFLSDEGIGGVGGRDWVYFGTQLYDGLPRKVVGRVKWFGRVIGNHHLGVGVPQEVDTLKGANMSYRQTAITGVRFDKRLRGKGSQIHNDLAFCLALRRRGWKLIYDPMVAVDHYQGQRFDEDQRHHQFNEVATMNIVHNKTLALLEHFSPAQRLIFLIWAVLVGMRTEPGFLQGLRLFPREGLLAGQKLLACFRGRWQAWQTWQASKFGTVQGAEGRDVS